jgi:hypothetical protein
LVLVSWQERPASYRNLGGDSEYSALAFLGDPEDADNGVGIRVNGGGARHPLLGVGIDQDEHLHWLASPQQRDLPGDPGRIERKTLRVRPDIAVAGKTPRVDGA